MTTATLKNPDKSANREVTDQHGKARMVDGMLTDQALLNDMQAYGRKVSATPEAARDFLTRLGVITRSGKVKKLIRD